MKPFFAALVILAVAFPAASQSNTAPAHSSEPAGAPSEVPLEPLSQRAQQAFDSCPALMARTESAIANGHVASFSAANCDCLAQSIDYNTWDDASASYSGPKMLDSDADLIVSAIATSSTLEDAFAAVDGSISEAGFSATSACYNK